MAIDRAFSSALRPRLLLEVKQANMNLIHQSPGGCAPSLPPYPDFTADHFSQGACVSALEAISLVL